MDHLDIIWKKDSAFLHKVVLVVTKYCPPIFKRTHSVLHELNLLLLLLDLADCVESPLFILWLELLLILLELICVLAEEHVPFGRLFVNELTAPFVWEDGITVLIELDDNDSIYSGRKIVPSFCLFV